VINDVAWHILLIAMLIWNLDAIFIDVESAFLYGDLDEEIYMDLPDGMMGFEDECLLLLKAIYGLVQAARKWHKKLIEVLKKIGFKGGIADPCLMMQQNNLGVNLMSVYADDIFCIGKREALKKLVRDLEAEGQSVKVSWDLKDYLSCTIAILDDNKQVWIGQLHLIKKLEERFGYLVNKKVRYLLPGTPNFRIQRPMEGSKDDGENISEYCLAVGTLLFLLKHSRPCLANPLRELSKVLDCPTEAV